MDNGASSYRRYLEGDQNAFVEIIRDYKNGLMFYLNGYVSDINIAEELAIETFVKIVTKKPRFSGKSQFKTWLYAIGRNIAVDYIKKQSKAKLVSIEDCGDISADEASLEYSYIREEKKIELHRTLKKLKPEYQQIIWLIYFENLTQKEAALVMKKSVHNIETLVSRARQSLKKELEKEGFVYEKL